MGRRPYRRALLAAYLSLAGCAGVPTLYASGQPSKPGVQSIARQISCELYSSPKMHVLADRHYFVTVLLTLQVDDNVDFTPSLGFIHPFAAAMQNVTTTAAADLGGARRRTFTTTYTLDAEKLAKVLDEAKIRDASAAEQPSGPALPKSAATPKQQPAKDWCDGFDPEAKRSFALNGTLGLSEIVDDGLGVLDPNHSGVHVATSATDKAAPSFGSYVQFVITRSMTALGPVWTVRRFKGPGGGNGLFNAKRLDTDSVLVTFAPQPPPTAKTTLQTETGKRRDSEQGNVDRAAEERRKASLAYELARSAARAAQTQIPFGRNGKSRAADVKVRAAATADQDEIDADQRLRNAQSAEAAARLRYAAADAAVAAADQQADAIAGEAPATAIGAAQSLQQTMLLQNLANSLIPH